VQSGDCKSRLESGNDLAVSWDLLMLQRGKTTIRFAITYFAIYLCEGLAKMISKGLFFSRRYIKDRCAFERGRQSVVVASSLMKETNSSIVHGISEPVCTLRGFNQLTFAIE